MLNELRAHFHAAFIETARARVVRVHAHIASADLAGMTRELHALAGEAALLKFLECARLAREGEQFARSGESRKCKGVLAELAPAIDEVAN